MLEKVGALDAGKLDVDRKCIFSWIAGLIHDLDCANRIVPSDLIDGFRFEGRTRSNPVFSDKELAVWFTC